MKRFALLCVFALFASQVTIWGQSGTGTLKIVVAQNPYTGDRASPEISGGPAALVTRAVEKVSSMPGTTVELLPAVALDETEQKQYGQWNRFGLANGHLGKALARQVKPGTLPVGLLANCSSLSGMLAGLQDAGSVQKPLRVGLVFIDAHGDFNTPETTLSGMLGGMSVAVAAGHCLRRMRLQSGLDPAIPEENIVLACARDLDPLERERLEQSKIEQLTVNDIRSRSNKLRSEMERLSRLSDLIYVHIDMDVLDPREVSGHPLTVPGGPTSKELAAALRVMFTFKKTAALGIASYPYQKDEDRLSAAAVTNLIAGAAQGVQDREPYN